MNNDTIELLQQVNAGCKTATNSMEQVQQYLGNSQLRSLIDSYNHRHIDIGDRSHVLLEQAGAREQDPGAVSKAFSWLSTGVKMAVDPSGSTVAGIMSDGCHMGVKNMAGSINKYAAADEQSRKLAQELVSLELSFQQELLDYL